MSIHLEHTYFGRLVYDDRHRSFAGQVTDDRVGTVKVTLYLSDSLDAAPETVFAGKTGAEGGPWGAVTQTPWRAAAGTAMLDRSVGPSEAARAVDEGDMGEGLRKFSDESLPAGAGKPLHDPYHVRVLPADRHGVDDAYGSLGGVLQHCEAE